MDETKNDPENIVQVTNIQEVERLYFILRQTPENVSISHAGGSNHAATVGEFTSSGILLQVPFVFSIAYLHALFLLWLRIQFLGECKKRTLN